MLSVLLPMPSVLIFAEKEGGQVFYNNSYIFPQVEPKMGTEALRGSEFARRVVSQGPGYRWSFVHRLPIPDSPRRLGRWGALDQPW